MAKQNDKYRSQENKAPTYDHHLQMFKMNSPVLNRPGVVKGSDLSAISTAHNLNHSDRAKVGHLENLVRELDLTHYDSVDAGQIQQAEVKLRNAEGFLDKINKDRQTKGKEPLRPCDLNPTDRQAKQLGVQQAYLDLLLMERDWLRKELREAEEQEKQQTKQKQETRAYQGDVQGYYPEDTSLPKAIDGFEVVRGNDGQGVFKDTGEPIGPYLDECKRRKQDKRATARKNMEIIRQREISLAKVPHGVRHGSRSVYDWLGEDEQQAPA